MPKLALFLSLCMRYFANAKYDKSLGLWRGLDYGKVGIAHHKNAQ